MIRRDIINKLIEIKTGLQLDNVVQIIYNYYRRMIYDYYTVFELARVVYQIHTQLPCILNKNKIIDIMMNNDDKSYDLCKSYYNIIQIKEDEHCICIYDDKKHKRFIQICEGDVYLLFGDEYTIVHITDDAYFCECNGYCIVAMHKAMNKTMVYRLAEFMHMISYDSSAYFKASACCL